MNHDPSDNLGSGYGFSVGLARSQPSRKAMDENCFMVLVMNGNLRRKLDAEEVMNSYLIQTNGSH